MRAVTRLLWCASALLSISACQTPREAATSSQTTTASVAQALDQIRPEAIRAHLVFLADDALEGRGTGTRGHELAAKYVRSQFEAFALSSGIEGSRFFQRVPLRRTEVNGAGSMLRLQARGQSDTLRYGTDYALMDTHSVGQAAVAGPVVFAGYGVTAPELGYDDYAGLDVRGKVVAVRFFEAPSSFPSALRAYYSDPGVKRANAAAHGAVAGLYVVSPAIEQKFPWPFLMRELRIGYNSLRWLDSNDRPAGINDQILAWGLLSASGTRALFGNESQGSDIALAPDKTAVFPLSKVATITSSARHTPVESFNVVALLEGSDPVLKNEYVVYTAHLDHLGIGPPVDGDPIYNGAMDNAGGCAVLLEVAHAFSTLRERPKRSILFVMVTGEEAGLLGSDYFVHNPPVPVERIVANINIDGGTSLTPVRDMIAWGSQHSSLGYISEQVANSVGLTVGPDPFPDEGLFVRSDQFSFVKRGIPSVWVDTGMTSSTPSIDALAIRKKWLVTAYHSPKDDASQAFDFGTSTKFARFVFLLGHAIAMDPMRPSWNPNDFFGKAK